MPADREGMPPTNAIARDGAESAPGKGRYAIELAIEAEALTSAGADQSSPINDEACQRSDRRDEAPRRPRP
eukprot:4025077-Alexandrium_andersonii.AAC.1